MDDRTLSLLFLAGDPSGDQHAAPVVRRVRESIGQLTAFGIGGPCMAREGFSPLLPFEQFNRMGFVEVLGNVGFFLRARRMIERALRERRPDALICVDYASFNMPIMKTAHALGIPVIWYISPKVWVWKKYRARTLGEHATAIATILPFEPAYFEGRAARVAYVGNPLIEAALEAGAGRVDHVRQARAAFERKRPWKIALVPGSRTQEIAAILPEMTGAIRALRDQGVEAEVRISKYGQLAPELYAPAKALSGAALDEGPLPALYAWADCALVTSGTATLEAAVEGVPFVLVYKTNPVNWFLGRILMNFTYVGLPNIIAQKEIAPERLQEQAGAASLASTVQDILDSAQRYAAMTDELRAVQQTLGTASPSAEVARMILNSTKQRGDDNRPSRSS